MQRQNRSRRTHPESGQTILLVALAIVSLLGMAALAIDVVTLYVARTEIQRAADATALAGAKAIADSGYTTLATGDPNYGGAQGLANTMAVRAIVTLVNANPPINLVAGAAPVLASSPVIDLTTHQGNALVTVTLNRSNLPTFFSKIFGRSTANVTATATAEAYNPSNNATFTPIAPLSLKPWLVANRDPIQTTPFINPTTGAVESVNTVVGEQIILTADCTGGLGLCTPVHQPTTFPSSRVEYLPLQVVSDTLNKNVCPSCLGATDYERSIECADVNTTISPSCGGGVANATWDNSVIPGGGSGPSALGGECLIHASSSGAGKGQDLLQDPIPPWPSGAFQIRGGIGSQLPGQLVTTSNSIVTIPIIDTSGIISLTGGPVTVVGYMQAFVNWVEDGSSPGIPAGDINITVLNISGCSTSPNSAPAVIGGAGTSPVPVRLITPP